MIITVSQDIAVLSNFIMHTPFAIYALLAILLIFLAYLITICLDEFYLKLLLPITYFCLLGFGTFYYWNPIIDAVTMISYDFGMHSTVIGMMPYLILLLIFIVITFGSMFMKKISMSSKVIHIMAFSVLQFLFLSLTYVFGTVEPSFTTIKEIYQNDMVVAILNCSVLVVISWFCILIITSLIKMIYHMSEDSEEYGVLNPVAEDTTYQLKQNISRLELEIERLKEQSLKEYAMILRRFDVIEDSLVKTNEYFLSQLNEVTKHKLNDSTLEYVNELQQLVEENYNIVMSELQNLRGRPETEMRVLKEKLGRLETMVFETNEKMMQQLELLRVTPTYEIGKMKDEMQHLEILLQRYMNDMNHELVQTKKEFQISKSNKRRHYYEKIR